MPETTATPTMTIETIDPTVVIVDSNIRKNVTPDKSFWAHVKQAGVLIPVMVERREDGTLHLVDGQRRILAALDAGLTEIPAVIRSAFDVPADQVLTQYVVNKHREPLTQSDEAAAIQELFELGMSAAQVATRTKQPRKFVDAVKAVSENEYAGELVEAGVDLVDAAAIAEFTDHPDIVERLTGYATHQPVILRHEIERARQHLAERAKKEALIAELEAAGYARLVEMPHWRLSESGELVRLDEIYTDEALTIPLIDDETYDADDFRPDPALPDVGFYVYTGYNGLRTFWYMKTPTAHGYHVHITATTPTTAATGDDEAAKEAASAERKRVIANNKAWPAATTVRREWIAELLQRKKLPNDVAAFAAASLAHAHPLQSGDDGLHYAAELAGIQHGSSYYNNGFTTALDAGNPTPDRILLALAIARTEHHLTPKDTWRYTDHRGTTLARYLTALTAWGYNLSDIETEIVEQHTPKAD